MPTSLTRLPSATRRGPSGVFPPPALQRAQRLRPRTAAEKRDHARLAAIGRTPVLERTPADHAFEDAFEIGEGWPSAIGDALAGLLAGHRSAERQAGRPIPLCLAGAASGSVETREIGPTNSAVVGAALRREVEL